ncbi:hypothetical protein FQN60_008425 [Etheostoma spectabile]|uniref:Uncharacterized protein n=1 Tax=Etheostoma spectabile TaxID=54343 RepID=A0A5J5CVP6_9PERO|nr:hypothetical protein FQN60_008425 [Etheostoma spectabile]
MEAKSKKNFPPKSGKKFTQKGKDSIGTKLGGKPGGKPGGKKPFKSYNNAERKGRPEKGGDGGKRGQKFAFSKDGDSPKKRKMPFKGKNTEEEGGGPVAKKMKKGEFKPKTELTEEELKKNRQQRKKDLKSSRQQAERKDMFQIICQCKLEELLRGEMTPGPDGN